MHSPLPVDLECCLYAKSCLATHTGPSSLEECLPTAGGSRDRSHQSRAPPQRHSALIFESWAVRVDSVANLSYWRENGDINDTCLMGDGKSKVIRFKGGDPLSERLSSLAQILHAMIEVIFFENGRMVSVCSHGQSSVLIKAVPLGP